MAAAKTAAQSALTPNLVSSSSSEIDSPIMDARTTRVNQVVAKRSLFNFDKQQRLKRHEEMENSLDMGQVKLAVERMGTAKRASPSPAMQGNCSKTRGSEICSWETLIADTGCSYNICSEKIANYLKLKVFPFKKDMSIVDASGNLFSLAGSAYLFIKTQVLGYRTVKLEVAVLKGNSTKPRDLDKV